MVLKGIINITQSSPLAKLTVLTIVAIPTIMTISMHGYALADGEPGYQLTVNVPSYPSGTSTLGVSITTANGYTDHANLATSSGTSWTFNIPANQGSSIRVCVNSDSSSGEHCNTYDTTSTDMSVSLSPPSGNSYYIPPGNTYYIYPGDSYGYYHHDRDHWFGGHENGRDRWFGGHQDHWFGGHQDSGNIGSNNGFGGHHESGNHGITEPADHLHHLSKGAPMMSAESSDDDSDFS